MLNIMVGDNFTNDQYQTLVDPKTLTYETRRCVFTLSKTLKTR